MANMYCKNQKANSDDYRDNYDANFRGNRDIPYPEEKRRQENDRLVKRSEIDRDGKMLGAGFHIEGEEAERGKKE